MAVSLPMKNGATCQVISMGSTCQLAHYPQLVSVLSGLVHPSFLSGLSLYLSHANHWGYNPLTSRGMSHQVVIRLVVLTILKNDGVRKWELSHMLCKHKTKWNHQPGYTQLWPFTDDKWWNNLLFLWDYTLYFYGVISTYNWYFGP